MKPFLEGGEGPRTVLVAREIEAISDVDIVHWANRHIAPSAYADDVDYIQLVRSNPRNATDVERSQEHLRSLTARRFPDFSDKSSEARDIARTLFFRRIRSYLDGEIEPSDVCQMVQPIEDLYDFPPWLGNLFNACDWLAPDAKREQVLQIRDAIEQILMDHDGSVSEKWAV